MPLQLLNQINHPASDMRPAGELFQDSLPNVDDVAEIAEKNNDFIAEELQAKARSLLVGAEESLAALDGEITRVQSLLNSLYFQRQLRVARMDIYRSAIAPQRKLPTELWSQIFLWCTSEPVVIPPHLHEPPWTIGRVCSKWRRVALGTSFLWTDIFIRGNVFNGTGIDVDSVFNTLTEMVLARSGRYALSAVVEGEFGPSRNPLLLFIPHFPRIKVLSILHSSSAVDLFLSMPPGSISSLESLTIDHSDDNANFCSGSIFQDAPVLRRFEFLSYNMSRSWLSYLPLSQITHLIIPYASTDPNGIVAILIRCPCLIECSFGVGTTAGLLPQVEAGLYTIPSLQSFQVNLFDAVDITCLQRLILPQIYKFEILSAIPKGWDAGWMPTLTRSRRVEHLHLRDFIFSTTSLEELMKAIPTLTVLDISSGNMISPSILDKMSSGQLVPKLSALRCSINQSNHDGFKLHLDMLEKRRLGGKTVAHIADVRFTTDSSDDRAWILSSERLQQFQQDGWNIQVR
ncbi:hypothetical protein Hypma_009206 [Hypsizygus marmoreus]|uniref:Uncharacterized protein n=1 Tax=Hypsizygus marmoreus TaxID=39966 RepID=A0A369JNR6_HYPMA|nr:hypothetical protein Hypma_009206 [Hypsizygus marmoreus]